MKKIIFLSITLTLLLTGCGAGATETLSCTSEATIGNITSSTSYMIDHQGDEVKKVRITYKYMSNNNTEMDGVSTGTDGTTNDTQNDNDGIIDGVIGSAIDSIVNGVTSTILDIAGIRDRHTTVQGTYGNIQGFSVQNTTDNTDNNYTVTYVIDYDTISDEDLTTLNLSRDLNTLRTNYITQGFTCK